MRRRSIVDFRARDRERRLGLTYGVLVGFGIESEEEVASGDELVLLDGSSITRPPTKGATWRTSASMLASSEDG